MSKKILLEDKVDKFIKEYKSGALLIMGGISIVNSLMMEVKPSSNKFFLKWIDGVLGPVVISDILQKELTLELEEDILEIINTTMLLIHRADLILNKIFQTISNSPEFVKDFLVVTQAYIEIEKLHNEESYKKHQKFIETIYIEDFKQSKEEVEEIKTGAKSLLEKLKNNGVKLN